MMLRLVTCVTLLAYVADVAFGYSSGVFATGGEKERACSQLYPNHGVTPQTSPSPYVLELNGPYWIVGSGLRCTLKSTDGSTFKGFMIQTRVKRVYSTLVGSFIPIDGTKKNCDDKALSHSNSDPKTSLEFIWNSPSSVLVGDVQFIYTVVKDKNTFWANMTSDFIPTYYDYKSRPSTTTGKPTTTALGGAGDEESDDGETGAAMVARVSFVSLLMLLVAHCAL